MQGSVIFGFLTAALYAMFAQQSFAGQAVPWGDVLFSAGKVFVVCFAFAFLISAPFRRRY